MSIWWQQLKIILEVEKSRSSNDESSRGLFLQGLSLALRSQMLFLHLGFSSL